MVGSAGATRLIACAPMQIEVNGKPHEVEADGLVYDSNTRKVTASGKARFDSLLPSLDRRRAAGAGFRRSKNVVHQV